MTDPEGKGRADIIPSGALKKTRDEKLAEFLGISVEEVERERDRIWSELAEEQMISQFKEHL
jgi:hypothetical protein